jgi:hypothetical protein
MTDFQEKISFADIMVADIHAALTTSKLLSVLSKLEYDITTLTGSDLLEYCLTFADCGGLMAIFLQLNSLLHRSDSSSGEYKLLCRCIDELLKNLPAEQIFVVPRIENSFSLMVEVLADHVSCIEEGIDTGVQRGHPSLSHSIMSTIHTISCTVRGSALVFRNKVTLAFTVKILSSIYIHVDFEAVHEALGVLKNLTYYEEGSRHYILKFEGMLLALTRLPQHLNVHENELISTKGGIRHNTSQPKSIVNSILVRLSAVLRNLSLSADCRGTLVRAPNFLNCTMEILSLAEEIILHDAMNSRVSVVRNIFNVLVNLAIDSKESALTILLHRDGDILRLLPKYIRGGTRQVRNPPSVPMPATHDPVIRKKSVRLVRVCINASTSVLLMHDRCLVAAITDAALLDDSLDVRSEAADTFSRLAGMRVNPAKETLFYNRKQLYKESLISALTELFLSSTASSNNDMSATLARAFKELAFNADNRVSMLNRVDLIQQAAAVANLSSTTYSATAVDDICASFMYLSLDSANQAKLCRIPEVLSILVEYSNPLTDIQHGSRESRRIISVKTMLNLASDESNLTILTQYPGLPQRLLQNSRISIEDLENIQPNDTNMVQLRFSGIKKIVNKIVANL